MPSSDSEDFESADEGHSNIVKKERKKHQSSSNCSDIGDSDSENKTLVKSVENVRISTSQKDMENDEWNDFDMDQNKQMKISSVKQTSAIGTQQVNDKEEITKDTGWDDFDDWGQDDAIEEHKVGRHEPDKDITSVSDQLAATTTSSGGWGWGWGVDSLLITATAGITTLTSQVSQSISTVLETGIGAPNPEDLARQVAKEDEPKPSSNVGVKCEGEKKVDYEESENSETFQFGSLLSGVTKFVETTGTKVISGGLDTLETIGKKTMEVLQDGDPGLAKKRAMLGLDPGDKPILSQVLREAKARADEEDAIREQKKEAKEVHYENLFDDFEGLVHLEALEMLSKQVSMRIEERIRCADAEKKQEIKETLQQVAELCETPEEEEDGEDSKEDVSKPDALHERLQTATQDLGLKIHFQPLIKQYTEILEWLSNESEVSEKAVYKRGVSALAQATALSVEMFHKTAEMLLVKTRRSTADEADALTQMTVVLTKHVSELATLFTEKMNSLPCDDKQQVNTYITNMFLEAGNSSTYIQNAFQLSLPILQVGAV